MTVVAGLAGPDEVEVEMIARAMDRRRNATEKVIVIVGAEVWTIGSSRNQSARPCSSM
jgi:hypothetical protein